MRFLVRSACDPLAKNARGEMPLSHGLRSGVHASVVEALLDLRASANSSGGPGETPLLIAARSSDYDASAVLILARADANLSDEFGETALMEAAGLGDENLCRLLLDARADVTHANQFQLTAEDFADDPAVANLLRSYMSSGINDEPRTPTYPESKLSPIDELLSLNCMSPDHSAPLTDIHLRHNSGQAKYNEMSNPCFLDQKLSFEWYVPVDEMVGMRRGEHLSSKSFKMSGVPCPLKLVYYPKGDLTSPRGAAAFGYRCYGRAKGFKTLDTTIEVCCDDQLEVQSPCLFEKIVRNGTGAVWCLPTDADNSTGVTVKAIIVSAHD